MILFYAPLACSFAARVVASEAGISLEYEQVDVFSKKLPGKDGSYLDTVPLGLVPVLRLPDGTLLAELLAISLYLAEERKESGLCPPHGTPEYYQVLSWHSLVGMELHKKVLWTLANPAPSKAAKEFAVSCAPPVLDHLDRHLTAREHLVGERFTIADAYLAWALTLAPIVGVQLGERPALREYTKRVQSRPSVREAMKIELPLAREATERQRHLLSNVAY
jgi:glutathione S-transferase